MQQGKHRFRDARSFTPFLPFNCRLSSLLATERDLEASGNRRLLSSATQSFQAHCAAFSAHLIAKTERKGRRGKRETGKVRMSREELTSGGVRDQCCWEGVSARRIGRWAGASRTDTWVPLHLPAALVRCQCRAAPRVRQRHDRGIKGQCYG